MAMLVRTLCADCGEPVEPKNKIYVHQGERFQNRHGDRPRLVHPVINIKMETIKERF